MGIIRDSNREFYDAEQIEDDLIRFEAEDELPEPSQLNKSRGLNKSRSNRKGSLYKSIDDLYIKKKMGANKARRCENLRNLLNLVPKEEWDNLEQHDQLENKVSVFAELLMETEKWEIWNEYINSSEEEQKELLEKSNQNHKTHETEQSPSDSSDKDFDPDSWELIPDMRTTHPAFTAEECYQRLDRRLRSTLKRRHFPQGLLMSIEEELVTFFQEWPTAIYISQLANSFERMLLHAICQYLDLKSKSFDDEGTRRTEVENNKDYFNPPNVLLSQYIQKNR
ncbi:unnamed protein product [Acanthosepion pharaonis]|uniref:R3H domain-containing protein n=1 Tax=Acanthosepion pharaonis TaxID=158019 RepID=A0A812AUD5_ACAPH|nr:unnamed protein product [Sepia pharaonis]